MMRRKRPVLLLQLGAPFAQRNTQARLDLWHRFAGVASGGMSARKSFGFTVSRPGGLERAIGDDWKGKLSPLMYAIGIGLSFFAHLAAAILYASVALIWLAPDRRVHRALPDAMQD